MNTQALKHNYNATDYSGVARYEGKDRDIMNRDMQRESYFQRHIDASGIKVLRYDTNTFPFPEMLRNMLLARGVGKEGMALAELHQYVTEDDMALDASGINEVTRKLYEMTPEFEALYRLFAQDFLCKKLLKEAAVLQNTPTLRCYFPKARGFNWKLNYHTDIMLGHPPQEINIWLPFTHAYQSNAMRIMPLASSLEVLERFDFDFVQFAEAIQTSDALQDELLALSAPAELEPGEVLLFDSRCLHVLQNNQTEHTRISMDMRVVPLKEYEALEINYVGTGRRRMPFSIGQYYSSEVLRP